MPIIFTEYKDEYEDRVTSIVYVIGGIPPELLLKAIQIEEKDIPKRVDKPGKDAQLLYHRARRTLRYVYTDRPFTPAEELEQVKEEQLALKGVVDELILSGMLNGGMGMDFAIKSVSKMDAPSAKSDYRITAIERYMAERIIEGAQDYAYVIYKRPDLKKGIDIHLLDRGYGHLITDEPYTP